MLSGSLVFKKKIHDLVFAYSWNILIYNILILKKEAYL